MGKYKAGQLVTVDNKVYRLTKFPPDVKEHFWYRLPPCFFCKRCVLKALIGLIYV